MSHARHAADEIAAVQGRLRSIPRAALARPDGLVEWLDEVRLQLDAVRKGLLAAGVPAVLPAERRRFEAGTIAISGRFVRVERRAARRLVSG